MVAFKYTALMSSIHSLDVAWRFLGMLPSMYLTQHVAASNGGVGGSSSNIVPEDKPHTWGCVGGWGWEELENFL